MKQSSFFDRYRKKNWRNNNNDLKCFLINQDEEGDDDDDVGDGDDDSDDDNDLIRSVSSWSTDRLATLGFWPAWRHNDRHLGIIKSLLIIISVMASPSSPAYYHINKWRRSVIMSIRNWKLQTQKRDKKQETCPKCARPSVALFKTREPSRKIAWKEPMKKRKG